MKKTLIIDFIIEIIACLFMICSLIYAITYENYLMFALSVLFIILNTLALYIIFSVYVKKCDLYISDYDFFKIFNKENVVLDCKKINNSDKKIYFLNYGGKEIEFRTDDKILGDQMFFSYVIRNIRFKEVSKKRPLIYIFKRKVRLQNIKLKNLTVILNGKKYVLVSNGISKCKFTLINKAWYWRYFLSTHTGTLVKDIIFIDENKFQKGKFS